MEESCVGIGLKKEREVETKLGGPGLQIFSVKMCIVVSAMYLNISMLPLFLRVLFDCQDCHVWNGREGKKLGFCQQETNE